MPKLKHPEFLNRLNTKGNKRKLLGLGVLLLIFIIGFAAYAVISDKLRDDRKVYAQAAGHKVYEEDVRDLIGNNQGISDQDAATVLADKYFTEALAKEKGITISDQELNDKYGAEQIKEQKSNNKYAYQYNVNNLYFAKLQTNNSGVYKGKFLIGNFSRNVAFTPSVPEDKVRNPSLGNPSAIAKDKKYAEDLLTGLYNDIKSGKITFEQAMEIEKNDPEVGQKAYPTLPHSENFDSTYTINAVLNVPSIKQKIGSIKPGELNEPFVVSTGNSLDGKSTAESYFLVVQMDESSGVASGQTFEQYVEAAKKRLKYEVFI